MIILGVSLIGITTKLLVAVNVVVCLLLIFVVLLQRPKNEGLGAAFGGDTASNIFGAQTTNVLANLTRWLAGIFMVVTLLLSILYSKNEESLTAVSKYIETERTKKKEDEARKSAEEAAKANAAKTAQPAAVSDPAKAPIEATPAVPAPEVKPVEPVKPAAEAPAPTPEPAKPAEEPKPAEPVKPADAPTPAPEPAKPEPAPAGN